MLPAELSLSAAAELLGMTPAELTLSRSRGLPPGKLGYTRAPFDGMVWFRRADLEAAVAADAELSCPDCGFVAKSPGGLKTHRRSHEV